MRLPDTVPLNSSTDTQPCGCSSRLNWFPVTPDFNTGENFGVGYFHVNQKRGVRWSSARAFLKPVLGRANLRLETGVLVEKLVIEGKRCVGVR